MSEENQKAYLGDGVYAICDGFGIWLYANSHENPTDKIYLEPMVLEALVRFDKRLRRFPMTNSNTGGRAFPSEYDGDCQYQGNKGMTLLDYFAGKALVGILSSYSSLERQKQAAENAKNLGYTSMEKYITEQTYEIADAMLAEKHRREGKDER